MATPLWLAATALWASALAMLALVARGLRDHRARTRAGRKKDEVLAGPPIGERFPSPAA